MEYFLSRAMEVCRLSEIQLYRLQEHEKNNTRKLGDKVVHREPRCLYPNEIQEALGLPSLKEHYGIPADNEAAQSANFQRLRGEFRAANLFPIKGDFNITDVEEIHNFDERVRQADQELKIRFQFSLPGGKRRMSDDV